MIRAGGWSLLQRVWPGPSEPALPAATVELSNELEQACYEAPGSLEPDYLRVGYRARDWFPHRAYCLPKCGPDGARLASRMCGVRDRSRLWQLVLFAEPPVIEEFPDDMFFDPDLLWHEQHLGRKGQVASVTLAAAGDVLYGIVLQSDLVQRISRRRAWKTRVETVFRGWDHMLLNAIVGFATRHGFREVRIPRSGFAMLHTDRKRQVKPELFERVYDRAVHHQFRAKETPEWWSIRVWRNRKRIAPANRVVERRTLGPTVCICHDIERGLGHRETDPGFAALAEERAPAALADMLAIERSASVTATYNVVGCLMEQVRPAIAAGSHSVAFHSYDHDLTQEQLGRCRGVDYRIKGYRAPRSRLTGELSHERLCWHNFEWFASSKASLGFERPRLADRLVTIPIWLDDFPLHQGQMSFDTWADRILGVIRQSGFLAIGLHDCYADRWLERYPRLLEEIGRVATFRTMDQVAAELYLAGGI